MMHGHPPLARSDECKEALWPYAGYLTRVPFQVFAFLLCNHEHKLYGERRSQVKLSVHLALDSWRLTVYSFGWRRVSRVQRQRRTHVFARIEASLSIPIPYPVVIAPIL